MKNQHIDPSEEFEEIFSKTIRELKINSRAVKTVKLEDFGIEVLS